MMLYRRIIILFVFIQLFIMAGCIEQSENHNFACLANKHDVFLYATNWSRIDTLAKVLIAIDDSAIINKITPRNQISSEKFEKAIRVCEGAHKIHVEFGRYSQDTTIYIINDISLMSSMVYEEKYKGDNGLVVTTLLRDNQSHRAD